MKDEHRVKPDDSIRLKQIDPDYTGEYDSRDDAGKDEEENREQLVELQELLYAEAKHALLIDLQAMDTGGKDGTIRHVMSGVYPQGCFVASFKAPSAEELAHDYLWRVHAKVPARGVIGIFNRSHYEDVLVVRVHDLVPKDVWKQRYEQINEFEHYLSENGVAIIKFFLHISKEEQKRRLQARLDDREKLWKFSAGDLPERERWDEYQEAYEDAINRTSTEWAPWYVVPADHKWYRNVVVSRIVVRTLKGLDMHFPESPLDPDKVVIPD
ncbi:MAG: polyphosphate kinase 2 family protein [Anaerolineae bacterium]